MWTFRVCILVALETLRSKGFWWQKEKRTVHDLLISWALEGDGGFIFLFFGGGAIDSAGSPHTRCGFSWCLFTSIDFCFFYVWLRDSLRLMSGKPCCFFFLFESLWCLCIPTQNFCINWTSSVMSASKGFLSLPFLRMIRDGSRHFGMNLELRDGEWEARASIKKTHSIQHGDM